MRLGAAVSRVGHGALGATRQDTQRTEARHRRAPTPGPRARARARAYARGEGSNEKAPASRETGATDGEDRPSRRERTHPAEVVGRSRSPRCVLSERIGFAGQSRKRRGGSARWIAASPYRRLNYADPFGLCTPFPQCLLGLGGLQDAVKDVGNAIKDAPRQFAEFWGDKNKGGLVAQLAMVPLTVPGGGGGVAAEGTVTLFRAVSKAEAADIAATGALRVVGSSAEGKYFATNAADAATWGRRMIGDGFQIVKAEFPAGVAKAMHAWDRLDGIGPARFATVDQLKSAVVNFLR